MYVFMTRPQNKSLAPPQHCLGVLYFCLGAICQVLHFSPRNAPFKRKISVPLQERNSRPGTQVLRSQNKSVIFICFFSWLDMDGLYLNVLSYRCGISTTSSPIIGKVSTPLRWSNSSPYPWLIYSDSSSSDLRWRGWSLLRKGRGSTARRNRVWMECLSRRGVKAGWLETQPSLVALLY